MTERQQPMQQDCPMSPESLRGEITIKEELLFPFEIFTSDVAWYPWKKRIEEYARWKGVWQYCDPDLPESFYPELEEPKRPHTLKKRPTADAMEDLGKGHFSKISACLDRYQEEYRAWAAIKLGIREVSNLIKDHVDPEYRRLIEREESPRKQLRTLASQSQYSRFLTLEMEWKDIMTMVSDPSFQDFFATWDSFFDRCSEFTNGEITSLDTLRNVLWTAGDSNRHCEPLSNQYWINIPSSKMPDDNDLEYL